jgi:chemotaxis protein histidine kinase CheA
MSPAQAERQVVVFSVLGEPFALPIASVQEIIRYTPPGATATASGLIRGMLSLRDRLIPIVDLSPARRRPYRASAASASPSRSRLSRIQGSAVGSSALSACRRRSIVSP